MKAATLKALITNALKRKAAGETLTDKQKAALKSKAGKAMLKKLGVTASGKKAKRPAKRSAKRSAKRTAKRSAKRGAKKAAKRTAKRTAKKSARKSAAAKKPRRGKTKALITNGIKRLKAGQKVTTKQHAALKTKAGKKAMVEACVTLSGTKSKKCLKAKGKAKSAKKSARKSAKKTAKPSARQKKLLRQIAYQRRIQAKLLADSGDMSVPLPPGFKMATDAQRKKARATAIRKIKAAEKAVAKNDPRSSSRIIEAGRAAAALEAMSGV